MRSSPIAVVGGLTLVLAAVAAASRTREPALPTTGVAIQTRAGVQLVGLDGRLRRTLPGYRFRALGVDRLGQVELRAPGGRVYELRGGRLVHVPANTTTLAFGFALRFEGRHWLLSRNGEVVQRFRGSTHVELDDTGTVLTSLRVSARGAALGASVAVDLRTGARQTLPRTCRVGAQGRGVRFELCGKPWDRRRAASIVRVVGGKRTTLVGPAASGPSEPVGSWANVTLSADGSSLLAQWQAECEVPIAYRIDLAHPRLAALAGSGVESRVLGWHGAAAIVALPSGACASGARQPGVYAFEAGRRRLLYPLRDRLADARLWR